LAGVQSRKLRNHTTLVEDEAKEVSRSFSATADIEGMSEADEKKARLDNDVQ
jgi:hypothetical protein